MRFADIVEREGGKMGVSKSSMVELVQTFMIFNRKKNFILRKKPEIPDIFGKRSNDRFDLLIRKYGKPEYNSREGQAQINEFGRASFPTGEVFVIDAKMGDVIKYGEKVRYIGISRGNHYYIHEDNELLMGDMAHASFPRNGNGN